MGIFRRTARQAVGPASHQATWCAPVSALILFVHLAAPIFAQETVSVGQSHAPLAIETYVITFPDLRLRDDLPDPTKIQHDLVVFNKTDRAITAYRISLATYDAFGIQMGVATGAYSTDTVKAGHRELASWVLPLRQPKLFSKYGTAVSFVDAVRFLDGGVWFADHTKINNELSALHLYRQHPGK